MIGRAHNDRLTLFGPRSVPAWVLLGLLLFNLAVAPAFSDDEILPEWLAVVMFGAWLFEPMLLAAWTALGPGAFIIRLSLAVPSLILLIAAQGILPGGFNDIERYEFKVVTIAGSVMFAADLVVLLVVRWFFGWRLQHPAAAPTPARTRFQFGVKYLIILLTLCAIVLGILSNAVFKPPPEPTFALIIFGPDFFLHVVIIGGITAFFAMLPLAAVPLIVLSARRSRRAIGFALGIWALTSVLICAVWLALGEENVLPLVLLLQLGAVLLGMSTAWLAKRAGYRL